MESIEDDAGGMAGDELPVTNRSEPEGHSRFKAKHSLDSDEEDNPDGTEQVMEENDIEGQEDATIDFDQGIKITPFNMKDELEEGHFDKEGTFIFSKEKEIRDEWMDNINWVKIHHVSEDDKGTKRAYDDSSDEDNQEVSIDEISVYREMIQLMLPNETVSKALRRLGGGKAGLMSGTASQRLKAKKAKLKGESTCPEKEKEVKANRENVTKLTGLADKLFQNGNLEVYQDTFEKFNFLIKAAEEKEMNSRTVIPEGTDADDALDMFADDFDQKDQKVETSQRKSGESAPKTKQGASVELDSVQWEYKWENKDDADVHGPFSSEEMAGWTEDNYFPDGVFVRKVGSTGDFYSSRRIDFELYM